VERAEYTGIVISDHAPHWLDIRFRSGREQRPGWRLDLGLLADGGFCNKMRLAIRDYVEFNQNGEVSADSFWEALKAVVRGEIIAFTVRADKERRAEHDHLVSEIVEVDREYSRVPTVEGLARRKCGVCVHSALYCDARNFLLYKNTLYCKGVGSQSR